MANGDMKIYLGIDVGGTKIQVSVVEECGLIRRRNRLETPRGVTAEQTVEAIQQAIRETLDEYAETADPAIREHLAGIGIAIPGVVDADRGFVVMTPNMSLTGTSIGPELEEMFGVPVAMGNDCNVGAMGEAWLGAARGTSSSIAILVGTGVGSGIIHGKDLWRGAREAAGEIGHIVMEIDGPVCGCGNKGCLEALASRTAIERQIREALDAGEKTALTDILKGDLTLIKSGSLRKALEADDPVVTRIMEKACNVLGHGCLTVRHLIDPEIIVFGGGVVEACGQFMLPLIQKVIDSDKLAGASEGKGLAIATLGDDAVVLGAVAMVRNKVGRCPFEGNDVPVVMPEVKAGDFGMIAVGGQMYDHDIHLRVDGDVKDRKKEKISKRLGSSHKVGAKEVARVCKGGPAVLFIGAGHSGAVEVGDDAIEFLRLRRIEYHIMNTPEAAEAYNACTQRKAAILHATC